MSSTPEILRRNLRAYVLCALALALGAGGIIFRTDTSTPKSLKLDHTDLRVSVLLENLEVPWDMAWSPDGWIWFTERAGKINRVDPDTGTIQHVHVIPEVYQSRDNSGLHALALHPRFPDEPFVYTHYTYSADNSRLVRFRFDASRIALEEGTILLDRLPAGVTHNGSRIVFDPGDGTLFLSLGDALRPGLAQDPLTFEGKILRLNSDGSVPGDNPISGSPVWTSGHRNPQGLVMGPGGIMYSSEHGGMTDDEINIIIKGANYGHPNVRGFCDLAAEAQFCSEHPVREPIIVWSPTIAPAGIEYYNHQAIPEWRNSLLVTTLKSGRQKNVGQRLLRLQLNGDGTEVVEENEYFIGAFGRLREVMADPQGRVFLFTSNREHNSNRPRFVKPGDDRLIMLSAQ